MLEIYIIYDNGPQPPPPSGWAEDWPGSSGHGTTDQDHPGKQDPAVDSGVGVRDGMCCSRFEPDTLVGNGKIEENVFRAYHCRAVMLSKASRSASKGLLGAFGCIDTKGGISGAF